MKDAEYLKEIGDFIIKKSPDNVCFFVFSSLPGKYQRARYISNMDRDMAIDCMKEFIEKHENNINKYGKHN